MSSFGDGILLEGAVNGVSRQLGLGAQRLVGGLAVFTSEAGAIQPFDAGVVANLDAVGELAFRNDDSGSLVAADQRVGLEWEGPVTV